MRHRGGVESPASAEASIPVGVAVAWRSKAVTTDPPRHAEHLEWQAVFTLTAPAPIRVVALLERGGETHWGLRPEEPARELELSARFFPWRWRTSDAVQVGFEGRRTRVTDRALKQDARAVAEIVAPASARTRQRTELMRLPAHAIVLAFLAFAQEDTETTRLGRWRLSAAVASELPELLAPLASGYQSGTLVA
jgi:hypothetical protein